MFEAIAQAPLLIFGRERASPARYAVLEGAGAQVQWVAPGAQGVDMQAVLAALAARGVRSVLVEGGGKLAAALVMAGLVDRLDWFRAPIVLGAEGKPAIAELALHHLADAPLWRRLALRELGPDLWESYERT